MFKPTVQQAAVQMQPNSVGKAETWQLCTEQKITDMEIQLNRIPRQSSGICLGTSSYIQAHFNLHGFHPQCLDINFLCFPSNASRLHSTFCPFFTLLQKLIYLPLLPLIPSQRHFHSLTTATLMNQSNELFVKRIRLKVKEANMPKLNIEACVYGDVKFSRARCSKMDCIGHSTHTGNTYVCTMSTISTGCFFVFGTILCQLQSAACKNPRTSGVSEILRPAHLASTTKPRSKSLRSDDIFPILMLDEKDN